MLCSFEFGVLQACTALSNLGVLLLLALGPFRGLGLPVQTKSLGFRLWGEGRVSNSRPRQTSTHKRASSDALRQPAHNLIMICP